MKRLFFVLTIVQCSFLLHAQSTYINGRQVNNLNTITTAVPFLEISPDPVASGMGEVGAATGNDVYSMYWNPAKYAVKEKAYESAENSVINDLRVGVCYSPWLRALVNDINFAGLYLSKRVSENSAVSGSFRMFDLGSIVYTNIQGSVVNNMKPYEWAADVAWSQRLAEHWYGAVAGRIIYSNLTSGQVVAGEPTKAGKSVAADLAVYYTNNIPLFNAGDEISFGINISNIGSKMNYSMREGQGDFIPTNLRIGTSYRFLLPDDHKLRVSIDFNKLLVPTPPFYKTDSLGELVLDENNDPIILKGMSPDVSVLKGMVQSFYDAPDGFNEELNEITVAAGAELMLYNIVSLRGGYFYEHESKGNRKFVTLGLGLHYKFIGANVSYLVATDRLNSLSRTWHFGLSVAL